MTKISPKKFKEESEFEHVANIYGQYMEALKKFPEGTKQEQQEFIVGFGKDMNTLVLVLQTWVNENDKIKRN